MWLNCSKTAGKYMISAVGPLKERLKKEKWLSKEETFIMANFFNMEEEMDEDDSESEEGNKGRESDESIESEERNEVNKKFNNEAESQEDSVESSEMLDITNMKRFAKAVKTPGTYT